MVFRQNIVEFRGAPTASRSLRSVTVHSPPVGLDLLVVALMSAVFCRRWDGYPSPGPPVDGGSRGHPTQRCTDSRYQLTVLNVDLSVRKSLRAKYHRHPGISNQPLMVARKPARRPDVRTGESLYRNIESCRHQ